VRSPVNSYVTWLHDIHGLNAAFGILLFVGAAFAWVVYFGTKRGSSGESFGLQLAVLGGGFASVALASLGFSTLARAGLRVDWEDLGQARLGHATGHALLIGWIEEAAKLVPVLFVLAIRKKLDRSSGMLLAACAGIGFATGESVSLFLSGELETRDVLARAAAAPLTHALFSIPWGISLVHGNRKQLGLNLLGGWLLAGTAHGLYDLLAARPNSPPVFAALVVLALWTWLIRSAPRWSSGAVQASA
jgi:RsiW-degrading membrane proteinase PrsW (M82 family)